MIIAITLAVLILSVIVHEVAHGYAAHALGDPTAKLAGRLTLNPLPHIDLFGSVLIPLLLTTSNSGILFGWAKPVPYNPFNLKNQRWGEAIVAVAGSATNIFLALFFAGIVRLAGMGYLPESAGAFAATVALVNLFLGLFNLIPFPPLDGYTVLRGVLPYRLSYGLVAFEQKMHAMGPMGILIILFAFAFILSTPFFAFVSSVFKFLIGS